MVGETIPQGENEMAKRIDKIDKFAAMVKTLKKSGASFPRMALEEGRSNLCPNGIPFEEDEDPEVFVSPHCVSFIVAGFGVGPSKVSVLDSVLWLIGFQFAKSSGDMAQFAADAGWNERLVDKLTKASVE
jgi:hypothetical protein